MTEFARYLVAAGVSNSQFTAISRLAYFRAASHDAKFRNEKINQSALAAMTGLTRSQVRALLKQADGSVQEKSSDRIGRLLDGWTLDPAFVTASYSPRSL